MTVEFIRNFETAVAQPVFVQDRKSRAQKAPPTGGMVKRIMDITLVVLAVPFLLPLMLGLYILVKLTSPGPAFYGHSRVGFGGREFKCWKFRSMVLDGDAVLEAHFRKNPADRMIWESERKLRHDPRVTPVGAVLRKLSLDELPQLFNVITGEMSLVGPRPVVRDELEKYAASAGHYMRARPGLTGLWQVSGRSETTYRYRVKLDRFYVSRWSALLDIWVILRTIPAVVFSRGAH